MTLSNTQKLPGLQSLRALAAGMVLIGHVLAEAEHYFDLSLPGDTVPWTRGVDLFFVISGFVIALSADRLRAEPVNFLKRRMLRVVPLYYVFTTLMVIVLLFLPGATKDTSLDPAQILSSYSFLPYAREDGRIAPVLSLGWTLNYEVFFYAMFALCLAFRSPRIALAAILSACVIAGLVYPGTTTAFVFWTNPLILEFLFGVGLARLYQTGWHRPNTVLAIAGLFLGVALLILLDAFNIPRVLAAGLPASLIVASGTLLCPNRATPGQLLGDASYALYLSHRFALRAATLLLLPLLPQTQLGAWIYIGLVTGLALGLGILTHLLLERPIMRALASYPKVVPA
ncbi:acyltransferase family protein [Roseovarius rhodophyticola]|uniref:Acyltransferase n=1 Tax=Roseovarius rhodophyticola TaxID=3080827 RepID=A0ABZ2TJH0_9RHOB|nr:acyltransferase [Roseovarius sp. W115]MDV2930214.1 acyltransferase [Roseovarius sp. W115]